MLHNGGHQIVPAGHLLVLPLEWRLDAVFPAGPARDRGLYVTGERLPRPQDWRRGVESRQAPARPWRRKGLPGVFARALLCVSRPLQSPSTGCLISNGTWWRKKGLADLLFTLTLQMAAPVRDRSGRQFDQKSGHHEPRLPKRSNAGLRTPTWRRRAWRKVKEFPSDTCKSCLKGLATISATMSASGGCSVPGLTSPIRRKATHTISEIAYRTGSAICPFQPHLPCPVRSLAARIPPAGGRTRRDLGRL